MPANFPYPACQNQRKRLRQNCKSPLWFTGDHSIWKGKGHGNIKKSVVNNRKGFTFAYNNSDSIKPYNEKELVFVVFARGILHHGK